MRQILILFRVAVFPTSPECLSTFFRVLLHDVECSSDGCSCFHFSFIQKACPSKRAQGLNANHFCVFNTEQSGRHSKSSSMLVELKYSHSLRAGSSGVLGLSFILLAEMVEYLLTCVPPTSFTIFSASETAPSFYPTKN